jgi:hypothetical protein
MTFDLAAVDLGMSAISEIIARRLDADAIVAARRRNYFLLLGRLRDRAPLFAELPAGASPLFYPLLCDDKAAVGAQLAARHRDGRLLAHRPPALLAGAVPGRAAARAAECSSCPCTRICSPTTWRTSPAA